MNYEYLKETIMKINNCIEKMRMIENNIDGSEELRADLGRVFGISMDFESELKRLKKEYRLLKDQL
tara:strand:+ start:1212 stop:1409 length:198 start_codon:yes stop_codon:yes gene_type:complete